MVSGSPQSGCQDLEGGPPGRKGAHASCGEWLGTGEAGGLAVIWCVVFAGRRAAWHLPSTGRAGPVA